MAKSKKSLGAHS